MKLGDAEIPRQVLDMEPEIKCWCRQLGAPNADEVFQKVCIECWRNRELLNKARKFDALIFTIVRNATFDIHRRKRKSLQSLLDEHDDSAWMNRAAARLPEEEVFAKEVVQAVRQGVNQLPSDYREIVTACDLHGEDIQLFAAKHGIGLEGAKSRLRRARHCLKRNTRIRALISG